MNTLKKITTIIAVFSFLMMVNQAYAQTSTVTAEGTVLKPISLTGTGLSFGSEVFPGSDKSIAPTNASAARFDISGEPGKNVNTSFTLPTTMANASNTTMPISFSTTDGGYAAASTDQGTQTSFDPNTGQSLALDATSGEIYIWLGGTISPTATQQEGLYSANITLDVTYPSN